MRRKCVFSCWSYVFLLKELLIDGIMGNLGGLFDNVNAQVGEIAVQVGTTPAAWHAGVFSLIRQLSETVILPIAGLVLTFVATYELIQMILEKNNMHDDVCCKRCISNASNTTDSQLICGTNEMADERKVTNGRVDLYSSRRLLHS